MVVLTRTLYVIQRQGLYIIKVNRKVAIVAKLKRLANIKMVSVPPMRFSILIQVIHTQF